MKKIQSTSSTLDAEQALVLAYLYDDLSSQQRQLFEQRLKQDGKLKQLFEQQKQLDQIIKPGTHPSIDKNRMDGVHWALHRRLRKAAPKQHSLFTKLTQLWQMRVNFQTQLVSMSLTFILGFILAGSEFLVDENVVESVQTNNEKVYINQSPLGPLMLIKNDEYEIVDLQLNQFDPERGQGNVSYSLSSQTEITGKVTDQKILNLLTTTMKNRVSDATRLELIEVLKEHTRTAQVRDALSYSLLNDPNPGVRMAAAESLTLLAQDKSIRKVLRQALQKDINSGIRVEVFQALIQHLDDQETIKTLKDFSINDSNYYIRNQAKILTDKMSAQAPQI